MRLGDTGYPLILISHRRRVFLETAVQSLFDCSVGVTDVIVVDDSGDAEHHQWLDDHGFQYSLSSPDGSSVGYLGTMQTAWETARHAISEAGARYAMLWEEDFVLEQRFSTADMATIMDADSRLAQLNLQRHSVYRIEKRLGYMQSHQRRGYDLSSHITEDISWVKRRRPFTTNPCLMSGDALAVDWPYRAEADAVAGGAEPAMSLRLEHAGYYFGWLGRPNSPHVRHIGTEMKSGKGY